MSKKLLSWMIGLVLLTCLGIMDYPYLAQMYHTMQLQAVMNDYQAGQQELSSTAQDSKEIIGIIEIPKIKLELPIYEGTSDAVLQKGVGHLSDSSFPGGGTDTHTCISGHRGLPDKKLFTDLDRLEIGDIFYIHIAEQRLAYQVYEIETVTPDNVSSLEIQVGKDLTTLITCTPYGINSHRLYVHGIRSGEEETKSDPAMLWSDYWWIAVTAAVLLWLVVFLYLFNRKEERKQTGERKEGYGEI